MELVSKPTKKQLTRNWSLVACQEQTKDYLRLHILQYVTHKSVFHIFYQCTWNVTRNVLLRRKCYAHLNKNAKQSRVYSIHAEGGITLWGRAGCSHGLFSFGSTGLSFTAFVSVVLFFTGTSVWGQEWRKEGLNDLRLTSGHYGTLGKTGSRNWGFDTSVWYFSYSAPCEAQTFITTGK